MQRYKNIKVNIIENREKFLKQGYLFNKYEYLSEANKEVYKNKKFKIDTKVL